MEVAKVVMFSVLLCIGLIATTIEVKPASARTNKPIELVYGPDIYGVACYKDARNTYGDPLSCVKVW